jgi:hypothetical protein
MEIKNTKHIKAHSVDQYQVIVLRHRRDKISKEYLDNLYRWILLNDLYLDDLCIPNQEDMAAGYEDRYIMTFNKYCEVRQDEIGYNDNCRGLYYCTFGFMPDLQQLKQDPRDRS